MGQRQGGAISWVKNNARKRGAAEVSGTPCGVLQSSSLLRVMFAIFHKRRKPRGENVKCLLLLLLLLTIDSKTERSFTSRGQKPGFRQSVGNDRLQNWPPGHRRPWSLKDGASPTTARHPAPRGSRVSTGRQAHTAPRRVRERKKRSRGSGETSAAKRRGADRCGGAARRGTWCPDCSKPVSGANGTSHTRTRPGRQQVQCEKQWKQEDGHGGLPRAAGGEDADRSEGRRAAPQQAAPPEVRKDGFQERGEWREPQTRGGLTGTGSGGRTDAEKHALAHQVPSEPPASSGGNKNVFWG